MGSSHKREGADGSDLVDLLHLYRYMGMNPHYHFKVKYL